MGMTYISNEIINMIHNIKHSTLYYPFYNGSIEYKGNISKCIFTGICREKLKWFNVVTNELINRVQQLFLKKKKMKFKDHLLFFLKKY